MLHICTSCTAAYAVDLTACPQCGATEYVEQGSKEHEAMGKIRHGITDGDATAVETYPQGLHPTAEGDLVDGVDVDPHGPYDPSGRPVGKLAEDGVLVSPGGVGTTLAEDAATMGTRAEDPDAPGVAQPDLGNAWVADNKPENRPDAEPSDETAKQREYDAAVARDQRGEATDEDRALLADRKADEDRRAQGGDHGGFTLAEDDPDPLGIRDGSDQGTALAADEKPFDEKAARTKYDGKSAAQLRDVAGPRGVSTSGSKSDLVERLVEKDRADHVANRRSAP